MLLLTSQKNTLFDLIENWWLSPAQFEFQELISHRSNDPVTNLIFKDSGFYYSFETIDNKHATIYCPGESFYETEKFPGSWELQLIYFKDWLKNLSREISTHDKWERLQQEIRWISINFEHDEDNFSVQEYEDLKLRITSLKNGIASIGASPEQITIINAKLDHLTELAKEMNKFDWKSLFIWSIVSIVIQLGVSPTNAQALWLLIKQVFNNYFLPLS